MQAFYRHLFRNMVTIAPLLAWLLANRLLQSSGQLTDPTFKIAYAAVSIVMLLLVILFMGGRLRARRYAWPFGPFYPHEFAADLLSLLILFVLVQWVV